MDSRSIYRLQVNHDSYPNLRHIVSEDYASLPDDQFEDLIEPMLGGMPIEDYENFLRSLSRVGQQTGNVLSRAAPGALSGAAQGASMGAAFGPYGALIGGALGAIGGGVQSYQASQQTRSPQPQRPTPTPTPTPTPAAAQAGVPGRPGTAPPSAPRVPPTMQVQNQAQLVPMQNTASTSSQLLAILSRPETLQALLAMAMGQNGRRNVQVGNTQVPVAAVTNLISTLAQRSALQQNAVVSRESTSAPEYLLDEYGDFVCDPIDSESRADVLLQLFDQQAQQELLRDEREDYEDELNDEYEDDDLIEEVLEDLWRVEMAEDDEQWEEELDQLFG